MPLAARPTGPPIAGIDSTNIPGLAGNQTTGNNEAMRGMLNLLSGSLSRVTQLFWLGSADTLTEWDDYRDNIQRSRTLNQREFSLFFKDDWKLTQNLTLNLGLRWDYYGVPWVSNGLTTSLVGGGDALFGYSGRGFDNWMVPGQRGENTELEFVGPGSPNPDRRPWARDLNNFGPAVGFAYQVPWLGGDTTIRGGYQLTYLLDRLGSLDGTLAKGIIYESGEMAWPLRPFRQDPANLHRLDQGLDCVRECPFEPKVFFQFPSVGLIGWVGHFNCVPIFSGFVGGIAFHFDTIYRSVPVSIFSQTTCTSSLSDFRRKSFVFNNGPF